MNTKKAFLLLNGLEPANLPDLSSYDIVCATDGAYNFLKSKNITPNFVTGDFDSIQSIPTHFETVNTPDQNFTDFDKALTILKERGYFNIDVYGASGKEHDHFLGNISTALEWKNKLSISFFDDFGSYFFINNSVQLTNVKSKTISLIPFFEAHLISTSGLQYQLKNESLTFGKRIGTRNKAIEDLVEITFEKGELLIYVSHN